MITIETKDFAEKKADWQKRTAFTSYLRRLRHQEGLTLQRDSDQKGERNAAQFASVNAAHARGLRAKFAVNPQFFLVDVPVVQRPPALPAGTAFGSVRSPDVGPARFVDVAGWRNVAGLPSIQDERAMVAVNALNAEARIRDYTEKGAAGAYLSAAPTAEGPPPGAWFAKASAKLREAVVTTSRGGTPDIQGLMALMTPDMLSFDHDAPLKLEQLVAQTRILFQDCIPTLPNELKSHVLSAAKAIAGALKVSIGQIQRQTNVAQGGPEQAPYSVPDLTTPMTGQTLDEQRQAQNQQRFDAGEVNRKPTKREKKEAKKRSESVPPRKPSRGAVAEAPVAPPMPPPKAKSGKRDKAPTEPPAPAPPVVDGKRSRKAPVRLEPHGTGMPRSGLTFPYQAAFAHAVLRDPDVSHGAMDAVDRSMTHAAHMVERKRRAGFGRW